MKSFSIIVGFFLIPLVVANINFLIVKILLVLGGAQYLRWDAIQCVYRLERGIKRLLLFPNTRRLALGVCHFLSVGLR